MCIKYYCMHFLENARCKSRNQEVSREQCTGPLVPEEIERAEGYWIMSAQREQGDWKKNFLDLSPFTKERRGQSRRQVTKCPLLLWGDTPYSSVRKSVLSPSFCQPILLSGSHPISKLIMHQAHTQVAHRGPERTLSLSRREYWITMDERSGVNQSLHDMQKVTPYTLLWWLTCHQRDSVLPFQSLELISSGPLT